MLIVSIGQSVNNAENTLRLYFIPNIFFKKSIFPRFINFFRRTFYRGSPHKTVKWETENTVLCEIVLCETVLELLPKTVLCETLLCTMRGIEIFQNQSYREISPM